MNRFVPLALAAAAGLVILVIGIGFFIRPSPDVGPPAVPSPTPDTTPSNDAAGGWIAYSTMPGSRQDGGGDIYVVREGEEPKLIAGRGESDSTNVCPIFSPDGTRLAYGNTGTEGPGAIVVVELGVDGSIVDSVRLDIPGTVGSSILSQRGPELGRRLAPCPRWSSDGTRVGYLDGSIVVMRGLDGSLPASADGDPAIKDFAMDHNGPLLSPAGDLIARLERCRVVVANADGTDSRVVASGCYYALGTWSPDGRRILYMQDVSGGDYTMLATSVEEPFDTVPIAAFVPVNHARSWPGHGDVSWQPTELEVEP